MRLGAPRLLYLAYHFPPVTAIGSVRAWNTAKRLGALGWSVTVVTPDPAVWRNAEEPEKVRAQLEEGGVQRMLTGHRWPMLAPDYVRWIPGRIGWALGGVCRVAARTLGVHAYAGWAASAQSACASLKPGDFDLILATGGPTVSFGLARGLSRRLGCPFVMDYRDPWTGNPHTWDEARHSEPSAQEAELIRDCAAATVVSPSWAKLIGETFGAAQKMHVISNGFDPEMFADVQPRRFDHFALVYAGTLYPPKRVLDPVLRAFRAFAQRAPGAKAKFHYFGDYSGPVREAGLRLGGSAEIVVHERVSRREALQAQKGADLLAIVGSVEERGTLRDHGSVPGKVFDCMALGRPALIVAPRDGDLRAVAQRAGGMRCFTGSEVDGMARYIADVAAGRKPPDLDRRAYQWDVIARDLDRVLRRVIAQERRSGPP